MAKASATSYRTLDRSPTFDRLSSSISGEESVTSRSSAMSASRPVHWPVPAAISSTRLPGATSRTAERMASAWTAYGSPSGIEVASYSRARSR